MKGPRITVGAATRLGRRDINEDAFLVDVAAGLFLVADGFGGESGRLAATTAVRATHEAVREARASSVASERLITEAFDRAHGAVKVALRGWSPAGGAALCLCLVEAHELLLANHGDTRAFQVRRGALERLTIDTSVRTAVLDPDPAFEMPDTGADPGVSPALGHDEGYRRAPPIVRVEHRPGDGVLLCSDGLWGCLGERAMLAALAEHSSPQAAADALVDRATEAAGMDNATAVLLRFEPER